MDKSLFGLTVEYYVLAQLGQLGLIGTLALSNPKGIDILVSNPQLSTLYKLEVKTTNQRPRRQRLFGTGKFWTWAMGEKQESIKDRRLFYCFVALQGAMQLPRFFIVPSTRVARYVKWQHRKWLRTRRRKVKPTTMRLFRIPLNDPYGYGNNWKVLGKRMTRKR